MPVADCCCTVRADRSTLSHVSVTCSSSPEVSSIAFHAQPPDLPPVPLMELGFAVICPLARHRRPQIQFLSIGSRVCSTLLSDIASRRHLCASLSLHLHQVVKRTFTSKRLNMLGTQRKGRKLSFLPLPETWLGKVKLSCRLDRKHQRRSQRPGRNRPPRQSPDRKSTSLHYSNLGTSYTDLCP